MADILHIGQLIMNLMTNAIYEMSGGDVLTIRGGLELSIVLDTVKQC